MAVTCWSLSNPEKRRALMQEIYTAVFARGIEMSMEILETIAADFAATGESSFDALDREAAASRHEKTITTALAEGVFGVPTFICGEVSFWGK